MKKALKRKKTTRDPKQESLYKGLVGVLTENGCQVRREKLKTGWGWRALSGKCRCKGEEMIFVDSVMDLEDQVEFLALKIKDLGYEIPESVTEELPAYLQQ